MTTEKPQEALDQLRSGPVPEDPFGKDWKTPCEVCDATPTVKATGLCGPCTWGESETAGGNW